MQKIVIGIDEVGRAASNRRASPKSKVIMAIDEAGRAKASPKSKIIIGIDEVGRGPLAGRVFVGAVALPTVTGKKFFKDAPGPLRDSKKLTERQREAWFVWMKQKNISYAYGAVSPMVIDRINISQAANRAASRALERLVRQLPDARTTVIADGSLRGRLKNKKAIYKNYPKADENYPAVSLASIVAKVLRDREMKRLHIKYPQYSFAIHKGYGTKKHYAALACCGPCKIHRLTFLKTSPPLDQSTFPSLK